MDLSNEIISTVDKFLGLKGKPYKVLVSGWGETNAYFWEFPSSLLDQELDPVTYQILPRSVEDGKTKILNIDQQLDNLRLAVESEPVIVYKPIESIMNAYLSFSKALVVAPYIDPYDAIRIEFGQLAEPDISMPALDWLIGELLEIDDEYGIDVRGAAPDSIEIKVTQFPEGSEALSLSKRLISIAPDIVGEHLDFVDLIDFHRKSGCIALRWDDLWSVYSNY
jgi:hypothetical protein